MMRSGRRACIRSAARSVTYRPSRRDALKLVGLAASALAWQSTGMAAQPDSRQIRHLVTLSFDDGFRKSCLRVAEIYESFGLSACLNVIATAHQPGFVLPNEYHKWPVGDFRLWNELQARGHEIMPHGYKHANLKELPLAESQDLIRRCLDVFAEELQGFRLDRAVFNFPYNASTTELETWLGSQVMAYRTAGPAINRLPHRGQQKLTCIAGGPDNIDEHLTHEIDSLLAAPSGWLIYNAHGLDEEGWGPLHADTLRRLLDRLVSTAGVTVVPAAKALREYSQSADPHRVFGSE